MFRLKREQKVCTIGTIKIGGQPGENPPLLISSMFHNGDKILESRKERKFDRVKARDYIKKQEELEDLTGIPALVALVATTADEMKEYIDFLTSITDRPFGIDMWVADQRLAAAKYVAELGLQDRFLYNSITPWDKDIPGEVAALKEMGIKHVVVQAFDQADQMPSGRVKSFGEMMAMIGEDSFETVIVDTSVMNLSATSFSSIASRLIKEEFGWPAGCAPSNGTHMWKQARELLGKEGFAALDAAAQSIATLMWNDFIFYGPIRTAPRIFPAVLAAMLMLPLFVFDEGGGLPKRQDHPLYKFFGEFAGKLQELGIKGE